MNANIAVPISFVNRHVDIGFPDNVYMSKGVGLRLRSARKHRGFTQAQLAEKAGVPQSTISEVETGITGAPSGTNLIKLAQRLKVSPDWLATGKGPMDPVDTPLSPEAVRVARDWESLSPRQRDSIAEHIRALAEEARSFGSLADSLSNKEPVTHKK